MLRWQIASGMALPVRCFSAALAILLCCIGTVLAACSTAPESAFLDSPGAAAHMGGFPHLPPSSLIKQIADLPPGVVKNGADFEAELPSSRATAVDSSAHLSPADEWWLTAPEAMAYATYVFSTDGTDPAPAVYCSFDIQDVQPPASHARLWLGLANWDGDCWDWYAVAGVQCRLDSLTLYLDGESRLMLTAAVLNSTCDIHWLRLGDAPPIDVALEASPAWGHAPLDVLLTAKVENADWHGVCRYQWDWDGDGAYDAETTTPEVEHCYSDTGLYAATVRITDAERISAIATATIDCFSWDTTPVVPGCYPFLLEVDGRPAIIYAKYPLPGDPERYDICFILASNAGGTSWNPPVTVCSTDQIPPYRVEDCAIVRGLPAICIKGCTYPGIYDYYYTTALNADGTEWTALTNILPDAPIEETYLKFSLAEIAGRPAVCYTGGEFGETPQLSYCRAVEDHGFTWSSPQVLDRAPVDYYCDMTAVGSRPAIAYVGSEGISYIGGKDSAGHEWHEPVRVLPAAPEVDYGGPIRCIDAEGVPAIVFEQWEQYSITQMSVMYVRALHAEGFFWSEPVLIGDHVFSDAKPGVAHTDDTCFVSFWACMDPDAVNPSMYYARGSYPGGDAWREPCEVYPDGDVLGWGVTNPTPLSLVGGRLCAVIEGYLIGDLNTPMLFTSRRLQ